MQYSNHLYYFIIDYSEFKDDFTLLRNLYLLCNTCTGSVELHVDQKRLSYF